MLFERTELFPETVVACQGHTDSTKFDSSFSEKPQISHSKGAALCSHPSTVKVAPSRHQKKQVRVPFVSSVDRILHFLGEEENFFLFYAPLLPKKDFEQSLVTYLIPNDVLYRLAAFSRGGRTVLLRKSEKKSGREEPKLDTPLAAHSAMSAP